jgi:hypothetical protein
MDRDKLVLPCHDETCRPLFENLSSKSEGNKLNVNCIQPMYRLGSDFQDALQVDGSNLDGRRLIWTTYMNGMLSLLINIVIFATTGLRMPF